MTETSTVTRRGLQGQRGRRILILSSQVRRQSRRRGRRKDTRLYAPEHFRESRIEVLQAFIQQHPLAILVSLAGEVLNADHVPMLLAPGGGGETLCLRGHVARTNPLWRSGASLVLAIFHGSEHYVSPSWYPSKAEHGKVVPTWNYSAVHVTGRIRFIEDAAWLRDLVDALTDQHETRHASRWRSSDAPEDFLEAMLAAIVGFEIAATKIEGKFKASQNRPAADRAGVAAALRAEGVHGAVIDELVRNPPG